jgi:hypothetical protein
LLALLADSVPTAAQFFDGFDSLKLDPENPENGWFFTAGDGTATMDFRQGGPGYASIFVDGTTDKQKLCRTAWQRDRPSRSSLLDSDGDSAGGKPNTG